MSESKKSGIGDIEIVTGKGIFVNGEFLGPLPPFLQPGKRRDRLGFTAAERKAIADRIKADGLTPYSPTGDKEKKAYTAGKRTGRRRRAQT